MIGRGLRRADPLSHRTRGVALLTLSSLIVTLLTGAVAVGERRPPLPWAELESDLKNAGYKTDSTSLITLAASTSDPGTRWIAIELLGLRQDQASQDVLRDLVATESDRLLQQAAAVALARLGKKEGLIALAQFLRAEAKPERQIYLAARLAEFGDPSGLGYVLRAASSPDAHLRYLSVAALIPFVPLAESEGPRNTGSTLLSLLHDERGEIREEVLLNLPIAAAKGLSMDRFRPFVADMITRDPEARVRERAQLALASIGEPTR